MYEPENNAVAQDSLRSVTTNYPKINCVIYDRNVQSLAFCVSPEGLEAGEV